MSGKTLQRAVVIATYVLLSFERGKDFMATASPEAIEKAVQAVIIPEAEAQAPNTKTVSIGQSPAEVEAALGKPDRIVNLGSKVTC